MTGFALAARTRRAPVLTCLLVAATGLVRAATQDQGELEAYALRCEARTDPLGVDRPQPRLSWKLRATAHSQEQTRWRIVAATTAAAAAAGQGDLWDSGVVTGDHHPSGVRYGGRVLQPHQDCYWAVRVWDRDGRPSTWSDVARFSVGPPDASWWQRSEWIGYDAEREPPTDEVDLGAARWIGHAADRSDAAPLDAPGGDRLYADEFEMPDGVRPTRAALTVLADNSAACVLNGSTVFADRAGWQYAEPLDVTGLLRAGVNDLRVQVHNDDAGPSGLLVHLRIEFEGERPPLEVTSDDGWRSAAPYPNWHEGALRPDAFAPVRVLGGQGMAPWGEARAGGLRLPPVPLLRRSFDLAKPVSRALLYGTALGNVDFHLNGARISDELFTPGWTDYRLRVPYRCWDVTERLRAGENVLAARLADGWYCGYIGWGRKRDHYGTAPRLRCVLRVEHEDGEVVEVTSDGSWRAAPGPTREADFLMGERHDARAELDGWDAPGFGQGQGWNPVVTDAEHDPQIGWHAGPPVVAVGEFRPVGRTRPEDGVHVFDLGRNFAGVVRLKVRAPAGTEVRLRFAERLNPDGTLYVTNLRGARCVDSYVCKGGGAEVWQPRFTFHGFQYVEVTGLPESPPDDVVTGVAFSSDTPVVGSFECSSPMLDQLASNVLWTQRANFIEVPTDCPQRDERLGWTGDAQVYVRSAALWCDVRAFFDKWLLDLADAQRGDGQFPMVAPLIVAEGDGGPGWADAGTIVPWAIYQAYGDRELLRRQYASMLRYVAFCQARSKDGVTAPEQFHCFGDWLSIDAATPTELIYCAYFARSVELTARAAEVLGEQADAERLWALHARVAQAYRDRFLAADGTVHGDTQCGYALTLAYGLADAERHSRVAEHLIERIEARDMHLSTGFLGTKDLMLVLSRIGRHDVAWKLLTNDSFPSWGFSIGHGATSIWERWDGWTPEKGFQDPGMNSFAHYSFGAVYQWMVENIGGIRAREPGYRAITIAPRPGGGLTWAKVGYDSVRGPIRSDWRVEDGVFTLHVEVPPGTTAAVVLPPEVDSRRARVEGGDPEPAGVQSMDDRFLVGSGHWRFTAPWRD